MIEKIERKSYSFVKVNKEKFRLFTYNGCPRCLNPEFDELCPKCEIRNVNFNLVSFGIYFGYNKWELAFGNRTWDEFSKQIVLNKPRKKTDNMKIKNKRGHKFAELLYWLMIEEKKINLNFYSMMVPIPSYMSYN